MAHGLRALFEFLFKYRPNVFEQGAFSFGAPASIVVLALIGLAIGIPALASYGNVRGKSTRRDRWVLGSLRVAALLVLLICLFRPMLLLSAAVPQRNFDGVLIDDSKSMRIADRSGRSRADFIRDSVTEPNAALLKALRARFQVRLFHFGSTTERIDDASKLTFDQNETRLGDALESARRELETAPISGLVVLTDGADNARAPFGDELLALRAKSVPVFTVGIGAERFDRDIEIQRVEAAHSVLQGGTLVADVLIRQRGYAGAKVPLIVEDNGHIVAQTEITLPPDGDVTPVKVDVRTAAPGARTFTFRIPTQPGEQVAQNNAQQLLVRVRGGREKILYVEGEPRHEMRFIRAAVEADSNLQLVVLQRTAESKFLRLNVDGPDDLTSGFPTSRAELFKYRAVILGSIEASFFTRDQLAMLAEFANVRGGGLLFLGGRHAFAEGGYTGTPLADVMPVVIDGPAVTDTMTFFSDLKPELTPAGLTHAVTQVAGDNAKSVLRWHTMPSVTSVNRIRGVKPGAVTLIRGTVPWGGRSGTPGERTNGYEQPILVYERYGRGLSAALPIQDSWLWQMTADTPIDDPTFSTNSRQTLRWHSADAPGRENETVAADQVNPHSPVELRADVSDSSYVKMNDAQVVAHVVSPSGAAHDVTLEWAVDRDGEYHGGFTPVDEGFNAIRVKASRKSAAVASDSAYVRVAALNSEFLDAEMHADLLKRIARETGGRFYTPATVGTLAEDVALSKRGVTVVNEMDLWDMPVNFMLLVALLSAEWGYRKLRGLA